MQDELLWRCRADRRAVAEHALGSVATTGIASGLIVPVRGADQRPRKHAEAGQQRHATTQAPRTGERREGYLAWTELHAFNIAEGAADQKRKYSSSDPMARGSVTATKASPVSAPARCASWLIRPLFCREAQML